VLAFGASSSGVLNVPVLPAGREYSSLAVGSGFVMALVDAVATCSAPIAHCTAKLNSLGCTPAIAWLGTPSAAASSGFEVSCSRVRNNKPGVLMYSVTGRAALPFQGGLLCVANPIRRTPSVGSNGAPPPVNDCSGLYKLDMSAFASGALGGSPLPALRTPGTLVNCQWWGRDFGASFNTTLSDALEYAVCR
jgi:hypothetical protein